VDSFDIEKGIAVLTADRYINLGNGEIYESTFPPLFGTVRYYIWISKYEMLDKASRKIRVYFVKSDSNESDNKKDMFYRKNLQVFTNEDLYKTYGLVMPMPRCGFDNEIFFEIRHNTNFTMRDINTCPI